MSYEDYLQHHGIPGMRWGRRNGPPYPLLRRSMSSAERKANPVESGDSKENTSKPKEEKTNVVDTPNGKKTVANSKNVKSMSDDELNNAINRLKKEKEYRSLSANDVTKGKEFIKSLFLIGGATAITTFVTTYIKNTSQAGAKAASDKTDPIVVEKVGKLLDKLIKKKEDNKA